jgi:hypothetical protein
MKAKNLPAASWLFAAALLALGGVEAAAQERKPTVMFFDENTAGQDNSGASADGSIEFELRKVNDAAREIWLWPRGHKNKAVKLCDTPGWGNMHLAFSPDNYWITVEDGGASLGISLKLFRRTKGVSYTPIEAPDLNDQAEKLALRQNRLPEKADFLDHRYVYLVRWSPDSRRILIELDGKGGDEKRYVWINRWLGIYDLGKQAFTMDLNQMNGGAFEISEK